jgi:chemotaxis protein MotA
MMGPAIVKGAFVNLSVRRETMTLFAALGISIAQEIFFIAMWNMAPDASFFKRIGALVGGDVMGGGYIQTATFFAFYWSLFEIFFKARELDREEKILKSGLLPAKEKHIIMPQEVNGYYLKAVDHEKKMGQTILASLVKKACLKFRSTASISEMIEIISIQADIDREKAEGAQSNIRYLTWVIPSVGFIGTVIGISQALQIANSGDMEKITATLGVAFDTTLISLVLSVIVMWFFHGLQEATDRTFACFKEYVIENLVNRIEMRDNSKMAKGA